MPAARLFSVTLELESLSAAKSVFRDFRPHFRSGRSVTFEKIFSSDSLLDFDDFVSETVSQLTSAGHSPVVMNVSFKPFSYHVCE